MSLSEFVLDPKNMPGVVAAVCKMIDEEVSSKGGLSGLALKAGYKAIQGVKPNFVRHVVIQLLPDFAKVMDPIWADGVASGNPGKYLTDNKSRVADAMLSITDEKSKRAQSSLVRTTYDRLRGSAKKNVEEAIPRLATLLQTHVK
jgi:hypothetical protein